MIQLSQETLVLIRELAAAEGVSMEEAVKLAVEQRARVAGLVSKQRRERDMSPEAVAARKARFAEFAARLARMPILDPRSPREIMDDINAR